MRCSILKRIAGMIGLAVLVLAWPLASNALELVMPEIPEMPEISVVDSVQSGLDVFSDVEITKTANTSTVAPGQNIIYTITIKNHGPNLAESVLSVDQLPFDLEFVSASSEDYHSFTGMWEIGDLAPDESVQLTIITKVKSGAKGEINNIADVTSTGAVDNYPTNNFAKAKVTVDPNVGTGDDEDEDDNDDNTGGDSSSPPPPIGGGDAPPPALAASISGSVFNDVNGDGIMNEDEVSLSGWMVYLDADDDGELDEGEVSIITASPYVFNNLADGHYVGRVVLQSSWQQIAPVFKHEISIENGASVSGKDFAVKTDASNGGGSPSPSGGGNTDPPTISGGGGLPVPTPPAPHGQVLGESSGLGSNDPGLQMSDIQPQILGATELPRTGIPLWVTIILCIIMSAGFEIFRNLYGNWKFRQEI